MKKLIFILLFCSTIIMLCYTDSSSKSTESTIPYKCRKADKIMKELAGMWDIEKVPVYDDDTVDQLTVIYEIEPKENGYYYLKFGEYILRKNESEEKTIYVSESDDGKENNFDICNVDVSTIKTGIRSDNGKEYQYITLTINDSIAYYEYISSLDNYDLREDVGSYDIDILVENNKYYFFEDGYNRKTGQGHFIKLKSSY